MEGLQIKELVYLNNGAFLWNKKNLNLNLRWHILRSYRFVAEVTFNSLNAKVAMVIDWFLYDGKFGV